MANELKKPACMTCGGSGWIGGPSYYAPDEGGEECPDCALPPVAGEAVAGAIDAEAVARYSFVCNAGCGVCGVKVTPFEYERTETLEGEHLGSKYQPQIVSACCGAEVHVYDNRADHWGAKVTLATPAGAIDARGQAGVSSLTADFRLVNREKILGAIEAAGLQLLSNKDSFWLHPLASREQSPASPDAGAGAVAEPPKGDIPPVSNAERGLTDAERSMLNTLFSNMSDLSDKEWRDHGFRRATFDRLQNKLSGFLYPVRSAAPASAPEAPEQQGEALTVADELAAFEAWAKRRGNRLDKFGSALGIWSYEDDETQAAFVAWRDRAALAAPDLRSKLNAAANYIDTLGGDSKTYRAALAQAAPATGKVGAVAWAAVHFGGKRDGKIYNTCDTREQIDAYIQQVEQQSDSLTLTARPIAFADALATPAPTVQAETGEAVKWCTFCGKTDHTEPQCPTVTARAALTAVQADKGGEA